MQLGICSFSFHRLFAAGKLDIFQYVRECKSLGCTQLDPWNAHLVPSDVAANALHAGRNPSQSHDLLTSAADDAFIDRVKAAGDEAGLPFGTVAVDGAHIYESTDEARRANRARAYRWLDVAERLGATQVRIDAGGPEGMPGEVFRVITAGYEDLVARGRDKGLEILFENHWGPTVLPEDVVRLCEAVEGLGLLYDTNNWKAGLHEEARRRCPKYARATHVKTHGFDELGNPTEGETARAVGALREAGYRGAWGIESVPRNGDEMDGAGKTIKLLGRLLASWKR